MGKSSSSSASPFAVVPIISSLSNPIATSHTQQVTHNPFLLPDKNKDKEELPGTNANGIIPRPKHNRSARKAAQTMKKVVAQSEKERVVVILEKSSAGAGNGVVGRGECEEC